MTVTQLRPADVFMNLIVTFLTPMFLSVTAGDVNQARAAAEQTVNAYTARDPTDLLMIAQAIALGLAVLSSISLSMAEDMPINLVLRLRGNAANLHRAAGQCRDALSQPSRGAPAPRPAIAEAHPVEKPAADNPTQPQPRRNPDLFPSPECTKPLATTKTATAAIMANARHRVAEANAALKATGRPFPAPSRLGTMNHAIIADEECRRAAWSVLMAAQECATGIANLSLAEHSETGIAAVPGTTAHQSVGRISSSPA